MQDQTHREPDGGSVSRASAPRSAQDVALIERKLASLVEIGKLISREKDRNVLLSRILHGGRDIAHCAAATLFLKTEHDTLAFALRTSDDPLPVFEIPLLNPDGSPNERFVVTHTALHNETVVIDNVYTETRFDLSGTKTYSENSGFQAISMVSVPLSPHPGEVIGVLQLINALDDKTGAVIPFPAELISFIEALASQSAMALENQALLDSQKALIDSLIKIIAGAIDNKSPYTGGHCNRVPELAFMLAEAVIQQDEGPFADFNFKTEEEWYEFRVGAWLHDCGKVTTPEYVADKATKLETIYNRIHEVRTRFEVLLRDARIRQLESLAAGMPKDEADAIFRSEKQQLLDDYAFVAECNIGGEFMMPESMERVRQIGRQTWQRHFDDRLGLSHEELKRHANQIAPSLPVEEFLLANKAEHLVPRSEAEPYDSKYAFKIKIPQYLSNFGELHNLLISRGTLNEEERFKINEHIIQTIVMLDSLPFPKHLARVPEYAGTHHETLIGTGYPRQLTLDNLSIPARIMAIADIFEALTASDRPYKKAKTLSESIKILSFFKKDKHIDADLFDLLLTSGVYKKYGEQFLHAHQLDEVNIQSFIG
jgi:HD-GYP domain-containing protein (c-di-GMP phosphodiesterase class II)